jgi:hypothetical protein
MDPYFVTAHQPQHFCHYATTRYNWNPGKTLFGECDLFGATYSKCYILLFQNLAPQRLTTRRWLVCVVWLRLVCVIIISLIQSAPLWLTGNQKRSTDMFCICYNYCCKDVKSPTPVSFHYASYRRSNWAHLHWRWVLSLFLIKYGHPAIFLLYCWHCFGNPNGLMSME